MSDRYLLDTHVLLWAVAQPERLDRSICTIIENNRYLVSVASLWELLNKKLRRDAPVKDPVAWWEQYIVRQRTSVIPIRSPHVAHLDGLPWHHRDPFDRILIAQSIVERAPLVTADEEIRQYDVATLCPSGESRL